MRKLTRIPRTLLLVLLSPIIVVIAISQTKPDPVQERQERLNSALLVTNDPVEIHDLIRRGADPNSCEQPSTWEQIQRDHPFLRYLTRSSGISIYQPALETWICIGQVNAVKALLAGGANPQQKDSTGRTALEAAREEVTLSYRRPGVPNTSDKILWMLEKAEAKRALGNPPAGTK